MLRILWDAITWFVSVHLLDQAHGLHEAAKDFFFFFMDKDSNYENEFDGIMQNHQKFFLLVSC